MMAVVNASDPVSACAICADKYFNSFMIGGFYWVSEQGFIPHLEGDIKVLSDDVNDKLIEIWKNEDPPA